MASGAVPGFVNSNLGSNTGTDAVGTKTDATCFTNGYCLAEIDPSLSGNLLVVFAFWDDQVASCTTAGSVSVTNAQNADTYTAGPTAHDTVNHKFIASFYKSNATAGTRDMLIAFAGQCNTVSAIVMQYYNVAASSPLDSAGSGNALANGTTTVTTGSFTTTVNGDLVITAACRTQNRQTATSMTAGAGFALQHADLRDGCMVEDGIQSSAGAINPSATWAPSSGGVAVGLAFKAATQGTAPSGMYIAHRQPYSTANATTGPFSLQFPSKGNLLVSMQQCGGSTPMSLSSISDGTNTWKASGQNAWDGVGSDPLSNNFYAENATASSSLALTFTTSGTGDCSFWMYDIVGAATAPWLSHTDSWKDAISGAVSSINPLQFTNGTKDVSWGIYPGSATSGNAMTLGTMGQQFNTSVGVTAPTGALFDSTTFGSENISGPVHVDENNFGGHQLNTNNSVQTWAITQSRTALAVSGISTTFDSFLAFAGTKVPGWGDGIGCSSSAAGTTLTCAIKPHYTGNMIAIIASTLASSGNITVADSASNTITSRTGAGNACTTVASVACMKVWTISSVNTTSSDTFTVTYPTGGVFRDVYLVEISGATSFDVAAISSPVISGGVATSPSFTTTGTNDLILAAGFCQGSCGNGTNYQFGRGDGSGNGIMYRAVTSSGSFTALITDTSSGTDGMAVVAFK